MSLQLRDALFIARFDLVQLFRQRETLLWTFLMPALFFYFIGTVTGGFGGGAGNPDSPDPLALVLPYDLGAAAGDDFLVAALAARLEAQNFAVQTVSAVTDETPGRRLILPPLPTAGDRFPGWTTALSSDVQMKPRFVEARRGNSATFDKVRVSQALYGLLLDMIVLRREGTPLSAASLAEVAARPRALAIDVHRAGARPEPPNGFAQAIPGTMVMFTMMILLTGGSILLVSERRAGLLRRLASTPISRSSVLLGKWLGRMGLALVQLAFAMLLAVVLFHMDWGRALFAVSLLLFLWAAFNASLSLLLASIARTEGQMTGMAVIGTMVMAALGGCWWPIEVGPPWMQALAGFLPTGWAMSGMHQLVNFGHGFGSAATSMLLLGTGSLVLGVFAARRFHYE